MYKRHFKNIFDFTFAFLAVIILSPLLILIWILVLYCNGKPIIYTQLRPGKKEKIFKVYKFRTMTEARDCEGNLLPDVERFTVVGSFLRRFSLDELPQLFNILKGDLSFVGPRPLLIEYLPLYNDEQKRRHDVKPGITGWAQVNGRNAISWKKKFEYDVWYVNNLSMSFDIKIILLTIRNVLSAKDINSSEEVTMERFRGDN